MTPTVQPINRQPDSQRREFLRRLGRLAAVALGVGAGGLAFWDRRGPQRETPGTDALQLPDFRVLSQAGKIAVAHGAERPSAISHVIAALGGMSGFVQPGDRVLLKVNAAFASPPFLGATTHPDAVRQVVQLCRQAGAVEVAVTDNPINDPAACFALSGIEAAAQASGARLILPRKDFFHAYSLPGGHLIRRWPVLAGPLQNIDKVIGIAPVKDHHRSGASMVLKNWYGLLGGRRNIFHQQIHAIIAELALLIKPTLVILDGTMTMTANGPTGGSVDDLKPTRTVIAGTDPVAVDAYGARLLGKQPTDLPYLTLAQKAGAGAIDYHMLKFTEVNA
jgi:uncharacterized protein (DUF362 family)